MSSILTLYGTALIIFIIGDMLWLGVVAKDFYWSRLGHLLGENVLVTPAVIFYLLFAAGVTYFVSYPLMNESLIKVALTGALFGFMAYATYDLTNHATMRDWPLVITLADIAWGSFLTALASVGAVTMLKVISG